MRTSLVAEQRPRDGAVSNEQILAAHHLLICRHSRDARLVLCALCGLRTCAPTAFGPTAFCWPRLRIWFRWRSPLRPTRRCPVWVLRAASCAILRAAPCTILRARSEEHTSELQS